MTPTPSAAPLEQLSAAEVEAGRRSGLTDREIRRQARAGRLAQLPPICSARMTAWACLLSPVELRRLILSGRLPARKVCEGAGQKHYEIERGDVLSLAAGLE